jgi:hypothetical protein
LAEGYGKPERGRLPKTTTYSKLALQPKSKQVAMSHWFLAILLKPLIAMPFFFVAACGRVAVTRWMKDSRLKRILLRRIS